MTQTMNLTATNQDRPRESWKVVQISDAETFNGKQDLNSRGWTHFGLVSRTAGKKQYLALVNVDKRTFSRID